MLIAILNYHTQNTNWRINIKSYIFIFFKKKLLYQFKFNINMKLYNLKIMRKNYIF